MIGQYAVVGQRDILLLPLFVERVPTALQQDALMEVTKKWRVRIYCQCLVCSSHRFRQHDDCRLPKTPTILLIRPIWELTTLHHTAWWDYLHTFDFEWLLVWCVLQRVIRYIIFDSALCESASYLFDGNGASTAQIALTVCTPSVWVTASPALQKAREAVTASEATLSKWLKQHDLVWKFSYCCAFHHKAIQSIWKHEWS